MPKSKPDPIVIYDRVRVLAAAIKDDRSALGTMWKYPEQVLLDMLGRSESQHEVDKIALTLGLPCDTDLYYSLRGLKKLVSNGYDNTVKKLQRLGFVGGKVKLRLAQVERHYHRGGPKPNAEVWVTKRGQQFMQDFKRRYPKA